jgi:hypothetical protein
MAHRTLLTLLVVALSLPAEAQSARPGVRLGLSLASISAGQLIGWNGIPQPGPIAGITYEVPWTRQAFFLIEPMYIGKGSLVQNAVLNTWTSTRLNYLEVPVLFKISTDTVPGGVFLTGGAMWGYWLSGRQVVRQDGNVIQDLPFALAGSNRRTQISMGVGLGFEGARSAFELRAQTSVTPFSPVVRGQNVVLGLHYSYYLKDR